jgi:hypothetical protein
MKNRIYFFACCMLLSICTVSCNKHEKEQQVAESYFRYICEGKISDAYSLLDSSIKRTLPYSDYLSRMNYFKSIINEKYGCQIEYFGSVDSRLSDNQFLALRYTFKKKHGAFIVFYFKPDNRKIVSYQFDLDSVDMIKLPVESTNTKEIIVDYYKELSHNNEKYLINSTSLVQDDLNYIATFKIICSNLTDTSFLRNQGKTIMNLLRSNGSLDSIALFAGRRNISLQPVVKLVFWCPTDNEFYEYKDEDNGIN